MVDIFNFQGHCKFVTLTSTHESVYLCMVDLANFKLHCKFCNANVHPCISVSLYGRRCKLHGHCEFVSPTSTLECVYPCMVDVANFEDTVSLQRQRPPWIASTLEFLYGRLCKFQPYCEFVTSTSTLEFLYLCYRRLCICPGHCRHCKFVTPISTLDFVCLCGVVDVDP